jgi:transcriptional regulator GlxA family with amidase domain
VSRATLARRFPAATGQTPAAYLTQWRMDLAAVRLRDTHDSMEAVAAGVGYGSVPAFTRAFARAHGLPPGRYRSVARSY